MEVTAKLKNAPLSAQKCRLVADLVRNEAVSNALDILSFTPKKGAGLLRKLLEYIIANFELFFRIYSCDLHYLLSPSFLTAGLTSTIAPGAPGTEPLINIRFLSASILTNCKDCTVHCLLPI